MPKPPEIVSRTHCPQSLSSLFSCREVVNSSLYGALACHVIRALSYLGDINAEPVAVFRPRGHFYL